MFNLRGSIPFNGQKWGRRPQTVIHSQSPKICHLWTVSHTEGVMMTDRKNQAWSDLLWWFRNSIIETEIGNCGREVFSFKYPKWKFLIFNAISWDFLMRFCSSKFTLVASVCVQREYESWDATRIDNHCGNFYWLHCMTWHTNSAYQTSAMFINFLYFYSVFGTCMYLGISRTSTTPSWTKVRLLQWILPIIDNKLLQKPLNHNVWRSTTSVTGSLKRVVRSWLRNLSLVI